MNPRHFLPLPALLLAAGLASAQHTERVLFLDNSMLGELQNVERRLHAPQPQEVVLVLNAPWEGRESGYASVMEVEDGFRLYYRGGGDHTREVVCVALSDDGINWHKPQMGLHEWEGDTENNIIHKPETPNYVEAHNFFPLYDPGYDTPHDERWKAVALYYLRQGGEARRTLGTWLSPDGFNWRPLSDGPAIDLGGGYDSLNVAFRDPWHDDYAVYSRVPQKGYRHIQYTSSDDFRQWGTPVPIEFPEETRTHFYTNGITPVPQLIEGEAGPWYVGMAMRFIPERQTVLSRDTDGVSDAVLIASRDRLHWDWVSRSAWIRPGLQETNWGNAHGNMTPVHGILHTDAAEWSVYWMENYGGEAPHIRRGTLRPEGFASLHAGHQTGTATIGPLEAGGKSLLLNASTSAAGTIRVGLTNQDGEPIPGYALEDSQPLWGDGLFLPVSWKDGRTIESEETLPPVMVVIELTDADLFALRLTTDEGIE